MFDPFTVAEFVAYHKEITGLVSTALVEETDEYWQYVNSDGTGTSGERSSAFSEGHPATSPSP